MAVTHHRQNSSSSATAHLSAALVAFMMVAHALFSGWQQVPDFLGQPAAHSPVNTPPAAAPSLFEPMAQLVEPLGYRLQEHFVETADGFILRMFRIPGRQAVHPQQRNTNSSSTQQPVVFLQHALMDSSAGWLLLGPGRSLALQLVDAGFDVWLGNSRGNRYSRNHTSLQPHQPEFWAWSWQQQAEYDLPASISYVLHATRQQRVLYVGYSQGTMSALAALSSNLQLASAVSGALLLAPVAFTSGMTSPWFVLSSRLRLDEYGLSNGWLEWGSHQPWWATAAKHLPRLCLHFLTSFCGHNPRGNIAPELVPLIFQHLPAGTSVRVMSHWAQGIRRRDRQHLYAFDFGTDCSSGSSSGSNSAAWSSQQQQLPIDSVSLCGNATSSGRSDRSSGSPRCNQEAYGQLNPPVYNMSAITTPLALFSGGRDTISTLQDVELLKQSLSPGVLLQHLHLPDWGHLDFELGADAPELLYPTLLQLARSLSGMA